MATPTNRKKSTGTGMVKWEEELAKYASEAAEQEASVAGGQFFSFKSGVMSFNDSPINNNQVAVIIVDSVMENTFYEGDYDSSNPSSPVCFAFGRSEKTMVPHDDVLEAKQAVNDTCQGCPMNEFGSADRGRGKACRNSRRLAVIPAGTLDNNGKFVAYKDPEHFRSAAIAFMKIPATSIRGYAAYVKSLEATLKRPPFAIMTRVKLVPDPDSQFKVVFESLAEVNVDLLPIMLDRHNEAKSLIEFPYMLEAPASRKPTRGAAGKTARGTGNNRAATNKPAPRKKY